MNRTKAEMQSEIDGLRARVAELEGEVKGLHYVLGKYLDAPVSHPCPMTSTGTWTWPESPFKITC